MSSGKSKIIRRQVFPGFSPLESVLRQAFTVSIVWGPNSILELITMGTFVGSRVVEYLKEERSEPPEVESVFSFPRFSSYLEAKGNDNIGDIREKMQSMMTENVGVFRTEERLCGAIETLRELNQRAMEASLLCKSLKMNQELLYRWELDNLFSSLHGHCFSSKGAKGIERRPLP